LSKIQSDHKEEPATSVKQPSDENTVALNQSDTPVPPKDRLAAAAIQNTGKSCHQTLLVIWDKVSKIEREKALAAESLVRNTRLSWYAERQDDGNSGLRTFSAFRQAEG
jgi:hypothetical protein